METIRITIPDNLDSIEETLAIANTLTRKMLPKNDQKLIGDGYTLQDAKVNIIITRKPVQKAVAVRECAICGTLFEQGVGARYYTNYGGVINARFACSKKCRDEILEMFSRHSVARFKKDLKFTWL